jgi:hypothetical protein
LPAIDGIPGHNNPAYKKVDYIVQGHGVNTTISTISVPRTPIRNLINARFRPSKLVVTTIESNNIVPQNYLGNITNCVACHNQTLKHSRQIDPIREWYGNVRGSDQIFSFNIFSDESVSNNGIPNPLQFRSGLSILPYQR